MHDEDLLGYLLGALEPHEMRRVAQRLRDDPAAREKLAEIERALKPLEEEYEPVEPPPSDLVSRTLASLPPLSSPGASCAEVDSTGGDRVLLAPMQSDLAPPRDSGATWLDWIGGSVAVAVILSLLLTSLAKGRVEARKAGCQDNLRQLGGGITQYVIRSGRDRLPAVAESGPEAFAGVYAVRLNDAGLIGDPSVRWCPSLNRPSQDQVTLAHLGQIAAIDDLHQAPVDRLRQIQQFVGGHYAYTLGVIEQNRLAPPRFESRSSFAVMSDAPLAGIGGGDDATLRIGHGATGINVLYEDGRVQFIPLPSLDLLPDHPLLNHRGQVEAGVNIDDASLAPSWRPPFINVRQR